MEIDDGFDQGYRAERLRADTATVKAAEAFARLLDLAETRNSGQIRRIARFIAATYNGQDFPFDLFELRSVDVDIGDDMLRCLDALRWARADLYTLVPDGDTRVRAVLSTWGLVSPSETDNAERLLVAAGDRETPPSTATDGDAGQAASGASAPDLSDRGRRCQSDRHATLMPSALMRNRSAVPDAQGLLLSDGFRVKFAGATYLVASEDAHCAQEGGAWHSP